MFKLKNVKGFIIIVVIAIVGGFYFSYEFEYSGILVAMMGAISVIIFFGVFAISTEVEMNDKANIERIRLALTATIIVEFFVYFGAIIFLPEEVLVISGNLLKVLTTIIGSVIAFYFGTETVKRISKNSSDRKVMLAIIESADMTSQDKKDLLSMINKEIKKNKSEQGQTESDLGNDNYAESEKGI